MKWFLPAAMLMAFICAGCTRQYKVPGDVLPKDKMEKVLWDMIVTDRYASTILVKDSTKDAREETFKMYEQVFKIHKISRDEFIKSFKFYLGRPDIAKVMFDSLAAHANRRREEMYKPTVQ